MKKARLFLGYQSCVQCGLKKQNGKIAIHYFIGSWTYKDEACKIQNRLWNDHPPSSKGLHWMYIFSDETMFLWLCMIRAWESESVMKSGGPTGLRTTPLEMINLQVVHSQHWHITRGGCPENVTRIHISEGEPEGWNNIPCFTLVSKGKTPAEIYQPFKISLYLNHQKGRKKRKVRKRGIGLRCTKSTKHIVF